ITKVNAKAYPYTVEVLVEEANWDAGLAKTHKLFEISKDYADVLKVGQNVKFNVNFRDNERNDWAFNFVLNDGKDTKIVKKYYDGKVTIDEYLNDNRTDYEKALNFIERLTPASKVTVDNFNAVEEDLQKLEDIYLNNNVEFKMQNEDKEHYNKLEAVRKAVKEAKAEKAAAEKAAADKAAAEKAEADAKKNA
ncbi:MAG: hypothetical protein E6987_07875, partial [Peptoniphilus harei]|nr:hypothetical protein [Peptoniphilus harei]